MLDIKLYTKERKEYYRNLIAEHQWNIKLIIFQVGDNTASNKYVANKIKDCESVGIKCELYKYTEDISEGELIEDIKLANTSYATGIIVQLPLPAHISEEKIKMAINPAKDVDGFHPLSYVKPATPQGIISYLEHQNYFFTNKKALVIGRSDIVGKPMAQMLLDKNCNVSIIHSKTSELSKRYYASNADLIVVATGHRNTLTNDDIYNANAIVFDVGINFNENGKMIGDCENLTCCNKTPVPGGCGLLTRLAIIENLVKLKIRFSEN